VLVLDYEIILDQILNTTVPYTDTFGCLDQSKDFHGGLLPLNRFIRHLISTGMV
jgi:hypothetical protein